MLTLTETLDQIKQLNTEKDIIQQACRLYLLPIRSENMDLPLSEVHKISIEIYERYSGLLTSTDLMQALVICISSVSAAVCKNGHEVQLLKVLLQDFIINFVECRKVILSANNDEFLPTLIDFVNNLDAIGDLLNMLKA